MAHNGVSDVVWNEAIHRTVDFNAKLEYAQRRRGAFYRDPHTGTMQCVATRVLSNVRYDPNDSCGYFEVWECSLFLECSRFRAHFFVFFVLFPKTDALRFDSEGNRNADANKSKAWEPGRPPKLPAVPANPVCPNCKRGSEGALTCMLCLNTYHGRCVDLTEEQTRAAKASNVWQCNWCKVCAKCTLGNDEDLFVLCDNCDSGYHIYCLTPKLAAVPSGAWRCNRCVECKACGSRRSRRWWDDYSLCDECHTAIRRGEVCPVCNFPHAPGAAGVLCDRCGKWVHVNGRCEGPGMTPELWAQLSSGAVWFQCATCERGEGSTKLPSARVVTAATAAAAAAEDSQILGGCPAEELA